MTTIRETITARIMQLTPADLAEYVETDDKLLWVEYTILDFATENGLSNRYAEVAEDILIELKPELGTQEEGGPIADVYWFDEFAAWGITLYTDDEGNRATDEDGREIEADWFALKGQAVEAAKDMLHRGEIARYDVYTKAGALQQSVVRKKGACTS